MLTEEFGILDAVLKCLDRAGACWRSVLGKNDIFITSVIKDFEQLFLYIFGKRRIEVGACADNNAEAGFSVFHSVYVISL